MFGFFSPSSDFESWKFVFCSFCHNSEVLRNPINLFAKPICKDLSMSTKINPLYLWRICFKANFNKYNIVGFHWRATVPLALFLSPPQESVLGAPILLLEVMIVFITMLLSLQYWTQCMGEKKITSFFTWFLFSQFCYWCI